MTEENPEIAEAARAARAEGAASNARAWLLQSDTATLCTTSCHAGLEGYPFGSVVPYALTAEGRPFILVAGIAAHTKNLRADPRASLFVRQTGGDGDAQEGWRLTVMGRWSQVPSDAPDLAELHARYAERVPNASGYMATHNFAYWQMHTIERVRYIAGFGRITWIDGERVLRDPQGAGLADAGPGAVAHMNADHAQNMVEMCTGLRGFTPERAEMVSLDRTGFVLRTTGPDRLVYFSFGREIDADGLRHAVVEVLMRARA